MAWPWQWQAVTSEDSCCVPLKSSYQTPSQGHFGDTGMKNLANNLNCTVHSLYSGLGGAELSLSMLHNQVVAKGWDAAKPNFAVACDIDPVCRSVLAGHKDPPEYIMADILDFVTDDAREMRL